MFNLLTSCWKHNLNKDCTFSVNFPFTLYALCDYLKFYCMTLLYPKSDWHIIQCSVRGQSECLQSGRGCWTWSIWWYHMDKSLGSSCQKISIPQWVCVHALPPTYEKPLPLLSVTWLSPRFCHLPQRSVPGLLPNRLTSNAGLALPPAVSHWSS